MPSMTAPKKRRRTGPAPKPEGPKPTIASFKGSREFAAWMDRFATFKRFPVSILIEHALISYAEREGFEDPPPER